MGQNTHLAITSKPRVGYGPTTCATVVTAEWPGLDNPRPHLPVRSVRSLLEERLRTRKYRRFCHQYLYRGRRWLWLTLRRAWAAVVARRTKSAIDALTGIPIALLVYPPYRDWVFAGRLSWVLAGLIVSRVVFTVWGRSQHRRMVRDAVREAQIRVVPAIEIARAYIRDVRAGQSPGTHTINVHIGVLLQSLVEMAGFGLQTPPHVQLHANLMLPMPVRLSDSGEALPGLGIVAYNTQAPANPSWTKVLQSDLVAGEAFSTGRPRVIEDTNDPTWCGVFKGMRCRNFVSYPLLDSQHQIIACVNLDADKAMVFRRKNYLVHLWRVISPQLALFAEVLDATRAPTRDAGVLNLERKT